MGGPGARGLDRMEGEGLRAGVGGHWGQGPGARLGGLAEGVGRLRGE